MDPMGTGVPDFTGMGKPMVLGCLGVTSFFEEHPYYPLVNIQTTIENCHL